MKKLYIIIIVLIYSCAAMQESYAFWIWTPKSNKFVNPKHVAKDTPEEQYEWAMKFFKEAINCRISFFRPALDLSEIFSRQFLMSVFC